MTVELVGCLARGQTAHVWLDALVQDEEGLWLDPLVAAVQGSERPDPRVYRHEDGTLLVDTIKVEQGVLGPRGRLATRSGWCTAPPCPARPLRWGSTSGPSWSSTGQTGEGTYVVRRADTRQEGQPFPEDVRTVHVLTAANPDGRLLTAAQNGERLAELRARVAEVLPKVRVVDARAFPEGMELTDSSATADDRIGPPAEVCLALLDADEDTVMDLAEEFGQSSLFRWLPRLRTVLTLDGSELSHPSIGTIEG